MAGDRRRSRAAAKAYDRFRDVAEHTLRETSTAEAPWLIVEASDPRYRDVAVGRIVLEAMRERLDKPHARVRPATARPGARARRQRQGPARARSVAVARQGEYPKQLAKQQERLARLTRRKKFGKRSVVVVFEGYDAAGKGGAIRRITEALDARQYTRDADRGAHRRGARAARICGGSGGSFPRHGHITIFDRSWYGRVLVERVEGFCADRATGCAPIGEINDFEEQLAA